MSEKPQYLIVSADVLPEVILKVMEAKQLLSRAQAKNSSDACRMVGISRSAYYKYKDNVQLYEERDNRQLGTLYLKLLDEPGVLSRVLKKLYEKGANILTVNQNIPVDAVAIVTISIRINCDEVSMEEILRNLSEIDGVVSVKRI
ncbi:MAG: ACT domain-containing protein [Candidatus Merdivicinus sp.]|jgi:chorismate mutase